MVEKGERRFRVWPDGFTGQVWAGWMTYDGTRWVSKGQRYDVTDDMAYNQAYPQATRLDLNDRTTWPEEGCNVFAYYGAAWDRVMLRRVGTLGPRWLSDRERVGDEATTGDLWLPLPPTSRGVQ